MMMKFKNLDYLINAKNAGDINAAIILKYDTYTQLQCNLAEYLLDEQSALEKASEIAEEIKHLRDQLGNLDSEIEELLAQKIEVEKFNEGKPQEFFTETEKEVPENKEYVPVTEMKVLKPMKKAEKLPDTFIKNVWSD